MNDGRTRRALVAAGAALLLAACAAAPVDEVVESLDPKTAVTVAALAEPLLYSSTVGAPSQTDDVAIGPFEVNRMGEKSWYLWANRLGGPDQEASLARLRIVSDGETLLELEPLAADVRLPVSSPPYRPLAEWAASAYYPITAEELARLQGRELSVELPSARDGRWLRFESWQGRRASGFDDFVSRQLAGRVAGR